MSSSIIYTFKGFSIPKSKKYKDEYFFQKELNLEFQGHKIELEVARILYENPLPNCVRVLQIQENPPHIKYELLDMEEPITMKTYFQINNALDSLHKKNIIYLDLKSDNMGYSYKTKEWKLFDFDCCGITKDGLHEWLIPPGDYFFYNEINYLKEDIEYYFGKVRHGIVIPNSDIKKLKKIIIEEELTHYDKIAFYLWCKLIL